MEADEVPLSKTERMRLLQLRRSIVVGIVGYGNTMAPTAKRAADLYISQAFQSARRWADACADDWVIVCPKHGLITPDRFLAPYRAKLGAMSGREKVEWGRSTILAIQHRYNGFSVRFVAVCCEPLLELLQQSGARIESPLRNKSMGERYAWFLERATQGELHD